MSTTVDSKVVEMRFDNRKFENNVQDTLSSLDKLKQSLNFTGAVKGFEHLDAAAKGVNMSGLGNAVEQVQVKFSALQVMATTALMNITNSAMNAGKKIVSALTIDPVKSGFQEYETQINAVQTILANTQSKGTTLPDVNKALDELNAYADKTIYNFTEMTRNIGTFTAAGTDLETSVKAIQGIANLAAVSGSTSQQASTAMYQLSQALSSGTVKLMDWNSVVNAGMGGQVFQDALKETARIHGVAIDNMIESEGSFRETLKDGWLTSEILTETLEKFTMAAEEGSEQWNEYKKTLMDKGYTEAQAVEILKLGNTATDAATKVKTFTQLFDTLKEAAQSGWTQTWEILIGDFEEAKELFSGISDFIGGFINAMSEARNKLLEGALGSSPFGKLAEKINEATGATNGFTKSLAEHESVVSSVIRGDWGNMEPRWEALTEAGYDCWVVQDMVNEQLGSSVRHYKDSAEAHKRLQQATSQTVEELLKMSDAQLENLGFTKAEIAKLRELAKQSEKTGIPIAELVKDLDQLNGRTLLINSFKNIGQSLVKVFTALGEAYREVFPAMTSDQLYNIIAAFHKFTTYLVMNDKTAENLKKTFKGVFAVFNIVWTTVKGVVSIFTKLLGVIAPVGGSLLDTILGFTGNIGEFLAGVSEAYRELDIFSKAADKLVGILGPVIQTLRDLAATIKDSVVGAFDKLKGLSISGVVEQIKTSFKNLKDTLSSMTFEDFKEIGKNMIDGLIQGVGNKITDIRKTITDFCTKVIDYVKDIFGIHSPSVVFKQIGGYIVDGFKMGLEGIAAMVKSVFDAVEAIVIDFIDTVKNIAGGSGFGSIFMDMLNGLANVDWKSVISTIFSIIASIIRGAVGAIGAALEDGTISEIIALINEALLGLLTFNIAGLVKSIKGITDGVGDMISPFAEIGKKIDDLLTGLGESLNGFIDSLTAQNKAAALKMIAKSIAILAVAVIALSFVDPDKVTTGLLALGGVIAELGVFIKTAGIQQMAPKLGASLLALSFALLVLSGVMAIMGNMDDDTIATGLLAIGGTLGVLAAGLKMMPDKKNLLEISFSIGLLAGGLLILSGAIAALGHMSVETLVKGIIAMGAALAVIAEVMKRMPTDGMAKTGASLVIIAGAMIILSGAIAILGNMSLDTLAKGIIAMGLALDIVQAVLNNVKSQDIVTKAASFVVMSAALLLLSGALKSMGSMGIDTLAKGLITMGIALAELVIALNLMKGTAAGAAAILVAALALAVLTPVLITLGLSAIPAAIGLLVVAGAFAVLGVAGLVLGPLTPIILALGAAIALVGVGCLSAGTGMLAFASALSMLAIVGETGGAVLVSVIEGLINLIPLFIAKMAEGIVEFAKLIGNAAPTLGAALTSLVSNLLISLLAAINSIVPPLFTTIGTILDELIAFLLEYVPKLIALGYNLLLAFLKGMRDNIYEITTTTIEIITEFLDGIAARIGDVIDSGINLILSFINGLADGVEKHAGPMTDAVFRLITAIIKAIGSFLWKVKDKAKEIITKVKEGISAKLTEIKNKAKEIIDKVIEGIKSKFEDVKNAAKDMMNGFKKGVEDKFTEIKNAATNVIDGAVQGVKDFLGINSPSRLFMEIGRYSDEGLAKGLTKFAGAVADSALGVGEAAVDSMSDALSGISGIPFDDFDAQPTITPVLDLTNVESGVRRLNGMLDKGQIINTEYSADQASKISHAMHKANDVEDQNGGTSSSRGNTYQFTQNNYSPKALSRTEIYRQTKNQFSAMERVTNK